MYVRPYASQIRINQYFIHVICMYVNFYDIHIKVCADQIKQGSLNWQSGAATPH